MIDSVRYAIHQCGMRSGKIVGLFFMEDELAIKKQVTEDAEFEIINENIENENLRLQSTHVPLLTAGRPDDKTKE